MSLPPALTRYLTSGGDLPPLVWHWGYYSTPVEPYRPEMFQSPYTEPLKPQKPTGGWWSFPVLRSGTDGRPLTTSWSRFCTVGNWGRRWLAEHGASVQRVTPQPDAVVYRVDSREALVDLAAAYPAKVDSAHPLAYALDVLRRHSPQVDWAAVATAGIDAVQFTTRGVVAARFAPAGEGGPALETWDVETVFWLHPRFVVDERVETVLVTVEPRPTQMCTCNHWRQEHERGGPCSKNDSYGCRCGCRSFELDTDAEASFLFPRS